MPGMMSLGVNSVYQMQSMKENTETNSTRPATTVASQLSHLRMKENASDKKSFNTFYAVYPTAEDN